MMDAPEVKAAPEVQHNFGVPISAEPQSLKEMYQRFLALEARVFALENVKPVEAPKPAAQVEAPKAAPVMKPS